MKHRWGKRRMTQHTHTTSAPPSSYLIAPHHEIAEPNEVIEADLSSRHACDGENLKRKKRRC